MRHETVETHWFHIFMAGDIGVAKQTCRKYCFAIGLCVTVEPCDYIYTGGEEAGFKIGLANYPRFPKTCDELKELALNLAQALTIDCCQHSFMIMGKTDTLWVSSRSGA